VSHCALLQRLLLLVMLLMLQLLVLLVLLLTDAQHQWGRRLMHLVQLRLQCHMLVTGLR
jgi:hypothetical protein